MKTWQDFTQMTSDVLNIEKITQKNNDEKPYSSDINDRFNELLGEIAVFDLSVLLRMSCVQELKRIYKKATTITGETSDGHHTFNELYHHRAVLFSIVVNVFKERSWKSKKHHDGTMFENMFIVGIETPDGTVTYHYDIEPYWDMFNCKELDKAPKWDGHTSSDSIKRLESLKTIEFHSIKSENEKWWNRLFKRQKRK